MSDQADRTPRELLLLRADLAAAARRRADRRLARRVRRWLAGLGVGTVLLGSAVAVGAGVVDAPGVLKGDAVDVTVVGGPGGGRTLRCTTRYEGGELCRPPAGGLPVGAFADRLRIEGAQAGIAERGTRCRGAGTRCVQLRPPAADADAGRGEVVTYTRTGVRPAATARATGGYRSGGAPLVTWLSLDGARPLPCTAKATARACRLLRAARGERPFRLDRLPARLGATRVVLDTGSRCRLATRFVCHTMPLADARALSAHPERLPRATVVTFSRVVVRR